MSNALIVGAGPAGLAAASELMRRRADVLVLDESPAPGGPLGRAMSGVRTLRPPLALSSHEAVQRLLDEIDLMGPPIRHRHTVIGAYRRGDGFRVQVVGRESACLSARLLLVATGAHERVVPFPGWTLPGVVTLGCLQQLLRFHGVNPGRRLVLSGSGPLVLATAVQAAAAGLPPSEVLVAPRRRELARLSLSGWRRPTLLLEGAHMLAWLVKEGVPVRFGEAVVKATGEGGALDLEVARLDGHWRPMARSRSVRADCLAVGHGLVSEGALVRQLGVPSAGGLPGRSGDQQMDLSGVFLAGDCDVPRGAELAILEGRLAGLAMAARLGRQRVGDRHLMVGMQRRLDSLMRAQVPLQQMLGVREGLYDTVTRDTVVCRCEGVRYGDLLKGLEQGLGSATELKMVTRIGMGRCQGRFCAGILASLLRADDPQRDVHLSVRPPVRPVSLGALAGSEDQSGEE